MMIFLDKVIPRDAITEQVDNNIRKEVAKDRFGLPITTSTPHDRHQVSDHELNDSELEERARTLFGGRVGDKNAVSGPRTPDPFENINTLNDMLQRDKANKGDKDDQAGFVEKSIVVNDDNNGWRYASPEEVQKPDGKHIIPLIRRKWIHGVKADKFVINENPGELYYDWTLYEEYIDTLIHIQGEASQWQKALFMKTVVGEELLADIVNNKWLANQPLEGIMHYDNLKQQISEHYKAFQDPMQAARDFMNCKQLDSEKISQFGVRLERARRMCGIKLGDERMRVALINGAKCDRLRKEAEGSASNFSFKDLISMGTRIESAEAREAEKKKNTSSDVLAINSQPSTSQGYRGGNAQFQRGGRFQGTRGGFTGMQRPGLYSNNNPRFWQPRFGQQSWGNSNRTQNFGMAGKFNRGAPRFTPEPGACKNCGTTHEEGRCFAASMMCHTCGKMGHIRRCCGTATQSQPSIPNTQVTPPTDT